MLCRAARCCLQEEKPPASPSPGDSQPARVEQEGSTNNDARVTAWFLSGFRATAESCREHPCLSQEEGTVVA